MERGEISVKEGNKHRVTRHGGAACDGEEEEEEAIPGSPLASRGRSNRWSTVGRLLWRVALAMLILAAAAAAIAAIWLYWGPVFLIQLLVVVVVAYFVSGGRLKWFYVALRTAPRDIT